MFFLRHHRSHYKERSAEITRQEKNWEIERKNIVRQNKIKNDYYKLKNKDPFHITTGKLALWILLGLCIAVIIFTGVITLKSFTLAMTLGVMPDFSPLVAMIGAIIAAALDVLGYFAKSAVENKEGGITYEKAKMNNFEEPPKSDDFPVG